LQHTRNIPQLVSDADENSGNGGIEPMPQPTTISGNPFLPICASFLDFTRAVSARTTISIATLGPAGTSSEHVARAFLSSVGTGESRCELFDSYEGAARTVESGENDLLLVANAYGDINRFYISQTLCLTTFFVHDTPPYGLARRRDGSPLGVEAPLVVATHPAPAHLLPWLMKTSGLEGQPTVRLVSSTSEAARLVAEGCVDACVTNDCARSRHQLEFLSRTRQIQMLWSVFKKESNNVFPRFPSLEKMESLAMQAAPT
jgi:prephenate decarboxylase